MKAVALALTVTAAVSLAPQAKAETLFDCGSLEGKSYFFSDLEFYDNGFVEDAYSKYTIELQKIGSKYDILWDGNPLSDEGWEMVVHSANEERIFISLQKYNQAQHYHFTKEGVRKRLIWTRHLHGPSYSKGELMVADCE